MTGPSPGYKREVLKRTDEYEIVLITWPPSSKSPAHDHGNSHGWTKVLKGIVCEKSFDKDTKSFIAERLNFVGEEFSEEPDIIHIVSNLSDAEEAQTLHYYAPPLKMNFYPDLA